MHAQTELDTQELPIWMRQARRRVDWGVLLVLALCLAVAWPLVAGPGLPRTSAGEHYVSRTADYASALQEGRLYPRWSAHAVGGYGAPIPHYYPPGAPYSAALLQLLFTNDAANAVRLLYIFALCLAGGMTYVFVLRWVGGTAGLLAAALYVCAPYPGYTAPYALGDLPGVLALGLLPALLWAITRSLQNNRPGDLVWITLFSAALALTDVRGLPVAVLLVVLLLFWHIQQGGHWRQALESCTGILLGVLAAAFYWLPALLEYDAVQWHAPIIKSEHRMTLTGLLEPLQRGDPGALLLPPQFTAGALLPLLALLAAAVVLLNRRGSGFAALCLAAAVALIAQVPLLPEETWLTGPITFCLAMGSTGLLRVRQRLPEHVRQLLAAVLVAMALIAAIPIWAEPVRAETSGSTTPAAQFVYQQQGFGIAVLPLGAAIPSAVSPDKAPSRTLLAGYQTDNINRFDREISAAGTAGGIIFEQTHSHRFQFSAREATNVRILLGYFPGWQATVDNVPVPLSMDSDGLITVRVPATRSGELSLTLGPTQPRTAAWIISWSALGGLFVITWVRLRRKQERYDDLSLPDLHDVRLIAVVIACFFVVLLLLNSGLLPLTLQSPSGHRLAGAAPLRSRADNGLEALAYRIEHTTYRPGDRLDLTLYWQALRFLTENYQVRVYLRDTETGIGWFRADFQHPGGYPTRRWPRSLYVADQHTISISLNAVEGEYQVAVEVYDCRPECTQENRLQFFQAGSQMAVPLLILPPVIRIEN